MNVKTRTQTTLVWFYRTVLLSLTTARNGMCPLHSTVRGFRNSATAMVVSFRFLRMSCARNQRSAVISSEKVMA